ncbi:unnamed protein product [Ixodes hexagonus]
MKGGNRFYTALLQLSAAINKSENLRKASMHVKKAAARGAQIICLSPLDYSVGKPGFELCAETIPGKTSDMLSSAARENGIYLVGGSMIETANGKMYSTCLVHGPDGSMIAKHRKMNLLDIDIPGKSPFRESDYLTPGDHLTTFDTPFCRVAVGLSQEIRFALPAHLYAQLGCDLLVFSGFFNAYPRPFRWELLQRARAMDNQFYVASVSPARNQEASHSFRGHSMLVGPEGEVIQSAGPGEAMVMAELDLDYLSSVRKRTPLVKQHRDDLYKVVNTKDNDGDREFFRNVLMI